MRKHNFKRIKRFEYLVISKCTRCGLEREKLPDGSYKLNPFDRIEQDQYAREGCKQ